MRPVVLALSLSACVWHTDLPSEARAIPVAAERELLISDAATLARLSTNRNLAPLSFRHAVSVLDVDPTILTGDAFAASDPPFRLIAIANRTDLSVLPDRAADGGEGRLVFALTNGPADDPSSKPLPFTAIFEYAQAGSARTWTERWHALGNAKDFDSDLVTLTETFVGAGAIAQIRTADARSGVMVMKQFVIDRGALVQSPVRNSPDWAKVSFVDLRDYATRNVAALHAGTAVMPRTWWAASASPNDPVPPWVANVPAHEDLVRATCGGCHESGFHVDPLTAGGISPFLESELQRRREWMQLALTR